jgi:acetyl esterase/lipase
MPWVLLAAGVLLGLMTVPAAYTVHHWALLFPAFVVSWLGTGMAGWWLAIVIAGTVALIALGALSAWPGWLGLALVVVSMAVLLRQARLARKGAAEFDRVLAERVAKRSRTPRSRRSMVLPWLMRDRGVERIKNVRYADGAGRRHLLDVYRPRTPPPTGAPVVLQIHGGGWTIGTKDTQGRPLMNRLARAGWVCVAANYRLSPRGRWPDHLVDAKLALAWIRAHIAEHGGDPTRVVVTGGSAGGHLTAMMALTQNDPRYQPGFEGVDTSVTAAIPMYGAYDLAEIFGRFGTSMGRRLGGWMGSLVMGVTPAKDLGPYVDASPIAHVTDAAGDLRRTPPSRSLGGRVPAAALRDARHSTPPFLVVHGTIDNLVPVEQARRFVAALREAGTDVTYVELVGAPHAFDVFHSAWENASTTGIEWWLSSVVPLSAVSDPGTSRSALAAPGASDPTTMARTAPS